VRAWQVWNEPNLLPYWPPKPSPAAYTRLLAATYRAIKRIDRRAIVVTAGMPFFSSDISALPFYAAMFRHGALHDFDALAFHPYAPTARAAMQRIFAVRALLGAHHAPRRPIWITEFGWASGGPPGPYTAHGPNDQRNKIALFLSDVMRNRRRLRLLGVVLWSWQDQPISEAGFDYWGLHAGLYTLALRPKPALGAFVAAAHALSR
jgi:hypothetical protein